jgi:type IX secretion system PorP/SprF family membrane protein
MKKILLAVILFSNVTVWAQDIHFSQFFNSPLTLNPALTGKMNGNYRIGFLYRNQWFQSSSTGTPFLTYSGFADAPIRFKKDALGLGIVAFQDNAGEGALKTLRAMASVAYHKGMGKDGRHSLSLGVQLGINQKKLSDGDIRTENQYTGTIHNANRPTGENLKGSNTKFDMNVGLHWNSMVGKRSAIYAGGSLFHVLAPENNFVQNVSYNLPRRFTVNGGADIGIGKKFSILPSVIFLYQDKAKELNLGAAFAYAFTESFAWYLGGYYRINDVKEPIAYTAFDFKGFRLGLSYDFALTQLNGSNKPGSIELSLIFVGKAKALPNPSSILFCPRF